eukprot:1193722-Ditylum_brightwellii.AAC.1
MWQQGQTQWEAVRLADQTFQNEEGQEDAPVIRSQQQDPTISVGQPGGEVMTSRYNCGLKIKTSQTMYKQDMCYQGCTHHYSQ